MVKQGQCSVPLQVSCVGKRNSLEAMYILGSKKGKIGSGGRSSIGGSGGISRDSGLSTGAEDDGLLLEKTSLNFFMLVGINLQHIKQ